MYTKLLINILGWTGSILYLLGYALVSMKKTEGDSLLSTLPPCGVLRLSTGLLRWYQGMNIFAGILLVVYTLSLEAYATTGLNAVWVAVGLFTLGRKWITRNRRSSE
jgi:hypothetical protein